MVLVTGAGPSTPGCCTTKELADTMAEACDCPVPDDLNHLDEFFQGAHDADADRYYGVIRDKFSPPYAADPRIYGLLVGVGFRAYVNLNYEPLLLKAMLASRGNIDGQFTYYPNLDMFRPYDLHSQRIVAIHGFADINQPGWERRLVLKHADYLAAYTNRQNADGTGGLLDWWCHVLSGYPCLFIGTSLNEPGIRSAINYLLEDKNPFRGHQHVCLVPLDPESSKSDPPPELEPLFETIQRVPYHPEDVRHRGLLRIWQQVTGISDPEIPVRRESIPELRFEDPEAPTP